MILFTCNSSSPSLGLLMRKWLKVNVRGLWSCTQLTSVSLAPVFLLLCIQIQLSTKEIIACLFSSLPLVQPFHFTLQCLYTSKWKAGTLIGRGQYTVLVPVCVLLV